MSSTTRTVLVTAFVALLLSQPCMAELVITAPMVGVAALAMIGGCWLLDRSGRFSTTIGIVLLLLAAVLAPLCSWPASVIAASRLDLGRWRWGAGGAVLLVAIAVATTSPDIKHAAHDLEEIGPEKVVESFVAVQESAVSALLPWRHPDLTDLTDRNPLPGILLVAAAVWIAQLAVVRGLRSTRELLPLLAAVGTLAPVAACLLGRPDSAHGALLFFVLPFLLARVAAHAFCRLSFPHPRAHAPVVAAGVLIPGLLATASAWREWSDVNLRWQARLAGDAESPYRFDYACDLLAAGDSGGYLREASTYTATKRARPRQRLAHAVTLIALNRPDEAYATLAALPAGFTPDREADVLAVLDLYRSKADWEGFLKLGDAVLPRHPGIRLAVADGALIAGRRAELTRHLDALLAEPRPSVQTFELAYRAFRASQNRAGLLSIGKRAVALHPDAPVGYRALGKAEKLVRHDDEMIAWYEKALDRDGNDPDLHYDLGLVYHGRDGGRQLAALHYREAIRLSPTHPRKSTIQSWIASLEASVGGG